MESPWKYRLQDVKQQNLQRHMRIIEGPCGPIGMTPEGPKLVFCSNDYLGLANNVAIRNALGDFASKMGVGATASRLVCGNTASHEKLEQRYCQIAQTDAAVLFPSGYQANVGAISALTKQGDIVFTDELVHASIIDGCRLSKARVVVYPHRRVDLLDALLAEYPSTNSENQILKLVITDAIFSMDGDIAPLPDLCTVAKKHNAHIYLDEAHSLGILGPKGNGLAAREGLCDQVSVHVGTLGKAVGVCGAIVGCDLHAAGLIRSRARSLLYTTAPPSALSEAALASLDIIETADDLRDKLNRNIQFFCENAKKEGLPILNSSTPIQPLVVGSSRNTMKISEQLWKDGIFVQGIRPPTVKEGTARLRITITAAHEKSQIETLVHAIAKAIGQMEKQK